MKSTISRLIITFLVSMLLVLGGSASFVWAAAKKAPKKSMTKSAKAHKKMTGKKQVLASKGKDFEINGVFPTVTGSDWFAVYKAYKAAGKKNKAEKALYFSDKLKVAEVQSMKKGK